MLTEATGEEAHLRAALATATQPLVVLVDDTELVLDSALTAALGDYLSGCRDADRALVLAGTTTDLQAGFRGAAAEPHKGRTGLLLSPEAALVTCCESDCREASPCRGLADGGCSSCTLP